MTDQADLLTQFSNALAARAESFEKRLPLLSALHKRKSRA